MKEQELKAKVKESLKDKGYHESQLKELNPIIQATIDATKQSLNLHIVSQRSELLLAYEKEEYGKLWWAVEDQIKSRIKEYLANNCG